VLVVALEADRLVVVLPGPAVGGVHQLRGDPLAAALGQHPVKPGEEDRGLQLEPEEKPDRPVLQAGDQLQDVVPAPVAAVERFHVAGRPKDLVVELADDGQILRAHQIDDGIGHGQFTSEPGTGMKPTPLRQPTVPIIFRPPPADNRPRAAGLTPARPPPPLPP
jgi:hypothetical protein